MVNSTLVELIKTLQPEELHEFRLFLDNPYHNRGSHSHEIVRLFDLIHENYPDFPPDAIQRNVIYARLYGEETPVKSKLEKIMTELSKHLRNFVITRHYLREENEFNQLLDWAIWLKTRNAEDRYRQMIDKLERIQEAKSQKDTDFHYCQLLLEKEKHNWEAQFNQKKGDTNLPKVIRQLDIYYYLNRLEYLNRLLLQQKVTRFEYPKEIDVSTSLYHIPDQYLQENPILFAEATISRLLTYAVPPIEELQSFMQWLNRHEQAMQAELRSRFWAYLRGLCSILINAGNREMIPVLHQIHQDNLLNGQLFFEGKLSSSAYKNVAHIGLMAGQPDWTLDFIERYKDIVIGENDTRDFYRSNMANYYFAVGEFEKALDVLPQASSYSDYHSALRRLELKIYFELESPLLLHKIDSFKMYVHRAAKNLHSEIKRDLLLNFVNILQQIVHSPKGDKSRSHQIIQRIERKKSVAEKNWLIEKARELA